MFFFNFKSKEKGFTPLEIKRNRTRLRLPKGDLSLTGFTFVEVLVSTVILALVLAGMLAGFAGGRLLSRRSRDRLIAQAFAREKLEELLVDYSHSYSLSNGIWRQDSISDQDFIRRTEAWREYKVEKIPNVADPTKIYYLKITVVVKWRFLRADVTHTESLTSLIYNPNYSL